MPKGRPKPTAREKERSAIVHRGQCFHKIQPGLLTHEAPVSPEEVLGQGVEGDVGARALGVVVRATELSAGGGKATAGNGGSGHSGAESGSGVHLEGERQYKI